MPRLPLFLLLLVASLLLAIDAQAQPGSITGRVVDASTNDPIPSASVAILEGAEDALLTGGITDMQGRFQIRGLESGVYTVEVSFVGYQPQRVAVDVDEAEEVNVGTIALASDVAALEGVEVTAQRQAIEVQIDRTVYNTADDPLAAGGVATDVLETIPSVDVDFDGNISLRGSSNVTVFINGRPAPVSADLVADYLRQLPAEIIDRVEVIPNPSARYEPEGMAGILNIVLKENTDPGLGGSITAGADTQGGYNATGLVTYGRRPWSLSANYGFRRGIRASEGSSYRINRYADPITFLDQDNLDDSARTGHQLGLTADLALAPRTTLSASTRLSQRDRTEEERTAYRQLDAAQDPLLIYDRLVDGTDESLSADVRLGLQHAFSADERAPHTLEAEARFDASVSEEAETFTERLGDAASTLREQQRTTEDDRDRSGSLRIDYVRPLFGFRAEAGYKGDLEGSTTDFVSESRMDEAAPFTLDEGLTNAFNYEEQVHAVYGQLARELGPVGVQVGVRLETAQSVFTIAQEPTPYENAYTSAFPSAFLTYELGEATVLRASYSRRVNRPRTWYLNPFPSFDDPLNVRRGNPYLRPEYVDAFEAGLVQYASWGSLTLTPYARRTTDVIRRIARVLPSGVTERTFENLDTSSSYGVEAIAAFEMAGRLRGLRGYASLEGFRMITQGTNIGDDLQNNAFGWGGRLNASYRLEAFGLPGADIQANLRYRAPMATEQGRTGARFFTDIALRQRFLDDRLNLNLQVRDPLGTAGFNYVLDQPRLYQEVYRDWGGQQVAVSLSYRFNQPERGRNRRSEGGFGGGEEDFGGGDY